MRIDVITLFPQLITPCTQHGIISRAFQPAAGETAPAIELHLHNPRDFADGNYRRIDDRPYGGGPGMVMMAEPLQRCLLHIQAQRVQQSLDAAPLYCFSPQGTPLHHRHIAQHAASQHDCILLCGRYEGIDQRFLDAHVSRYISLGDFVLSGGEPAAIAYLDALARLLPGVLGTQQSHIQDSFNPALDGLLDAPHYTRPEHWQEQSVPAVLLSGDHAAIAQWRRQQSLHNTRTHRPDLLPDTAPTPARSRPRPHHSSGKT